MESKKVYDFSFDKVRDQVARALRRHDAQGTVADVVGLSGLPRYQVEQVLPAVVSDCRGQMAVTESGEILYRFPQGLTNPRKGFFRRFLTGAGKVLRALFKAWIVVMLVGYFILFLLILVAALLISIGASIAKRNDDRDDSGGGFLAMYSVTRLVEFFVLLWLYSGDPDQRVRRQRKPFHKAVFEFVFGVEDKPEIREKAERKAFVALVRRNKGTVSLEELMALTGKARGEADGFISRLMLEFEGEPRVSDAGTLNFFFPGLLKTSGDVGTAPNLPDRPLIPFTRNPGKTNGWIGFFNGFNILFGGYFLAFGLQGVDAVRASGDSLGILYVIATGLLSAFSGLTMAAAQGWILGVLGVVPVVYSAFFFGIPLLRRWRERRKNRQIQTDNLRRRVAGKALERPSEVRLDEVEPSQPLVLKEQLLRDLAGDRPVDVLGVNPVVYSVPELEREIRDLAQIRKNTDLSKLAIGKVVFDTEDRLE
jgi:hypothetical protein